MRNLRSFDTFKKELLQDKEIKAEYERLEPEFQLMAEIIKSRKAKNISQSELAVKSKSTQGKISRIEAGVANPTIQTVDRIARALGKRLQIRFV